MGACEHRCPRHGGGQRELHLRRFPLAEIEGEKDVVLNGKRVGDVVGALWTPDLFDAVGAKGADALACVVEAGNVGAALMAEDSIYGKAAF